MNKKNLIIIVSIVQVFTCCGRFVEKDTTGNTDSLLTTAELVNQTINFSLFSALIFCVCGIVFSVIWLKYFKTGPLEWLFCKVAS